MGSLRGARLILVRALSSPVTCLFTDGALGTLLQLIDVDLFALVLTASGFPFPSSFIALLEFEPLLLCLGLDFSILGWFKETTRLSSIVDMLTDFLVILCLEEDFE